jgi:hypothetical protein
LGASKLNFVRFIKGNKQITQTKKTTYFRIHTHYIHSMVVQDVVSGRVCCVNQFQYELWMWRVVMRFVHATGKTWYKVLYKYTLYVISLSNISIKTNIEQITRVEIRLTKLYNTLRETTFYAWRLLPFILLLCYRCSHWRVLPFILMIWRHDKIVWQRRYRATSRHSFITTVYLVSDRLLSLNSKENVQNVR